VIPAMSFQRLYQDAMLVRADHEVRTGTPPAVLVKMPPNLDPLHRCTALVAGRRGKGDEILSLHGVRMSLARVVLDRICL
jgi:transposase